jgi:hypothetical protein
MEPYPSWNGWKVCPHPRAPWELAWQWVFAATRMYVNRTNGLLQRIPPA